VTASIGPYEAGRSPAVPNGAGRAHARANGAAPTAALKGRTIEAEKRSELYLGFRSVKDEPTDEDDRNEPLENHRKKPFLNISHGPTEEKGNDRQDYHDNPRNSRLGLCH
jgi:hypothetical protein